MKHIIIIITAILIAGCNPDADWQVAPRSYYCDTEQMIKVKDETLFCTDNTDYLSRYCYGVAIMNNCTQKNK